jgi:hypothetical protein
MQKLLSYLMQFVILLAVWCAFCAVGILVYVYFFESAPAPVVTDDSVISKPFGHVKGKTNLKPSFTLELIPNRGEGMPVIDIGPDNGAGIEGELNNEELERTIAGR